MSQSRPIYSFDGILLTSKKSKSGANYFTFKVLGSDGRIFDVSCVESVPAEYYDIPVHFELINLIPVSGYAAGGGRYAYFKCDSITGYVKGGDK